MRYLPSQKKGPPQNRWKCYVINVFIIIFLYIEKVLPTTRRIFSPIMLNTKKAFTLLDHLLFLFVELLVICTDVEKF